MADIFISYSREDREWVSRFANALTAAGFTVWWDRKINLGAEYDVVIEQELNVARATIVVWSKKAVTSSWVRAEARKSLDLKTYFPILREMVALPFRFEGYQTADFMHWNGDPDAPEMKEFLGVLQEHLHPGNLAAAPPPDATRAPAATQPKSATPAVSSPATPAPPTGTPADGGHAPPIVQNFFKGLATPKPFVPASPTAVSNAQQAPRKDQTVPVAASPVPSLPQHPVVSPPAPPKVARGGGNLPVLIALGVGILLLVGVVLLNLSRTRSTEGNSASDNTGSSEPYDATRSRSTSPDDDPSGHASPARIDPDRRDPTPPSEYPVHHDSNSAIEKK